jgi:UDP-3-O-[3-hydroxymyristoyl] glucosamine N-acyltransferase
MSGSPAFENAAWLRSTAAFSRLPQLVHRIRDLEKEIQSLKNALK